MNNTMNEQSAIEVNVMRRVRRIRILRLIISGAVFAVTAAILALYAIGREVWVARVFANGPQGFYGHILYLGYALDHTRLLVQILVLICVASFVYLAREVVRVALGTPPLQRA